MFKVVYVRLYSGPGPATPVVFSICHFFHVLPCIGFYVVPRIGFYVVPRIGFYVVPRIGFSSCVVCVWMRPYTL